MLLSCALAHALAERACSSRLRSAGLCSCLAICRLAGWQPHQGVQQAAFCSVRLACYLAIRDMLMFCACPAAGLRGIQRSYGSRGGTPSTASRRCPR